ncbi:hypothetical protein ACXYTJ_00020 [Gilvimarinus sp. F26214L]|uniref:hypothetical protein n=1 Tax=Gilvimarinus sp. DZF01 TaxID=3461371 RepID=UPI00404683D8
MNQYTYTLFLFTQKQCAELQPAPKRVDDEVNQLMTDFIRKLHIEKSTSVQFAYARFLEEHYRLDYQCYAPSESTFRRRAKALQQEIIEARKARRAAYAAARYRRRVRSGAFRSHFRVDPPCTPSVGFRRRRELNNFVDT